MSDDVPDEAESDIRRRAAWLLAMLALVAALLVTVFVTFFNNSGGNGQVSDLAAPTSPNPVSSSTAARTSESTHPSGGPTGSASATSPTASGSPTPSKAASCPDANPCALQTDIGNAIKAINDYRAKNGKSPVPGSVSEQAKLCALNNGSGCSGGWAETQVPTPDGAAAVRKILQFGRLTSDMKSIEVGWAFDPKAKQYYFAIIRQG